MSATLSFWVVVVAVGALTYLSRLSFISLFARVRMPSLVARALRYVPAAMLAAIVLPAVALRGSAAADPVLEHAKLAAAVVAVLVAWRTRNTAATIVSGMAALWLAQWLFRAAA